MYNILVIGLPHTRKMILKLQLECVNLSTYNLSVRYWIYNYTRKNRISIFTVYTTSIDHTTQDWQMIVGGFLERYPHVTSLNKKEMTITTRILMNQHGTTNIVYLLRINNVWSFMNDKRTWHYL